MFDNYFPALRHTDLNMYQCGSQKCPPGHGYGPAVRDHYLIHFIHSGKGFFQIKNRTWHLGPGDGFLICPDLVTYYEADRENPWSYSWVGFHGLKAGYYLEQAGLTAENPVFHYEDREYLGSLFHRMQQAIKYPKSRDLQLLGLLYLFVAALIEAGPGGSALRPPGGKQVYVTKAVTYIAGNYSQKITVDDIAGYIGLNRRYFSAVFKEILGVSPQRYIMQFRMDKACELMQNEILSIGDIARSVGYDDPLTFSKAFKKLKGLSPRAYRKKLH